MKIKSNDRSLESYKIFPYIAWIVTLGFSVFVYNITMELKAVAENLQAQTKFLQEQIDAPTTESFEKPAPAKNISQ